MYFPRGVVYLGYMGIFFGIINALENIWLGAGIMGVSALISFNKSTLEIDVTEKRSRVYPFLFGFKTGSWTSLTEFTEMAVLRKNVSEKTYGGRSSKSVVTKDVFYDICLLNASHRKKFRLKRFHSKETAQEELLVFSNKLKIKSVKYNPVISTRTERRR